MAVAGIALSLTGIWVFLTAILLSLAGARQYLTIVAI
jgi:hypothetical protein